MKRFLLFFVAALLFVACDNKFEDEGNTIQRVSTLPTLTAEFAEDATRTYVKDNSYLRWHEGDLISAFVGNSRNSKYIFDGKTGDNSGKFEPVSSNSSGEVYDLNRNCALYPYDEDATVDSGGSISCSLPAVQEYAEESFGKGANTMVAVTKDVDDTFLAFKNACGYLKIKLYGNATVESIELKGNNGEKIAGEVCIITNYGSAPVVKWYAGTDSITLDCGEGVKLSTDAENPTEFWFVVPPTEFSEGLTIVATNIYGATFEKSTNKKVTITRNEIQPMAAVETIFEFTCNEIWYTSSDGEIVEPYLKSAFGANIVSNTYENGKGVITFDGDVTTIGKNAFTFCDSLTSIIIPDSVTTIGKQAFTSCNSLSNIIIPNSATTIGEFAFHNCSSLTSVTIGNSVTSIGEKAFYDCTSLKSVYCKAITPPSLDSLAFYSYNGSYKPIGCSIYVPQGSLTAYRSAAGWSNYADDIVEYDFETGEVVPEGQPKNEIWYTSSDGKIVEPYRTYVFGVTIVSNTYKDGKGVITFSGNVPTIGYEAFKHCTNLTSISIPSSVTGIGDYAFLHCRLTSITIPDSVERIGKAAFSCPSLKEIKGKFASDGGRCIIIDGVLNCFALDCGATEYTIPDSVTTIGSYAFFGCTSLTSVTIPDNVTTIGDYVFEGCDSLTSVTIPDSVTTIGDYAFLGCDSLTSVTIPDSITTIKEGTFQQCSSLTSITIPDSVTTIGNHAFCWCESLTSVTIGDSVTSIEFYAFCACDSLTSITLPNSLTTIGKNAFYNCTNLESVTIPDNVITIGEQAFANCITLSSVTLNSNLKEIGDEAFSSCALKSVTIPESVETFGAAPFLRCENLMEFNGKFASGDKTYLIANGRLVDVAYGIFKELSDYTIPAEVTHIGGMVFECFENLKSITIPEGVVDIGFGAFAYCYRLTGVTIPSTVTDIGSGAFYHCYGLSDIYFRGATPPNVYIGGRYLERYVADKNTIIRVPDEYIDNYKNSSLWGDGYYIILGYNEDLSTDYSEDGKVTLLNRATKGNGIDIVIMGDAYSDRQIAAGGYSADINKAIDALFSEEPYKSFRDYFNVYMVTVVSTYNGYGFGTTALGGYFGSGTLVGGNDSSVINYAQKAISDDRMDDAMLVVIMNREYYAGTCYMYSPSGTSDCGKGLSISYFPLGTDDSMFAGLIRHETGGHGFAKLADEYSYSEMGRIPESDVQSYKEQTQNWGWWKNVDFTSDTSAVRWSHFINDNRYANEGLGAFEGGLTYWSGVWRPTKNSIMNQNTGGFNAPSREAIYYRIHKLAYGDSWEYDYEKFVEWDKSKGAAASKASSWHAPLQYPHTTPPVVVGHSWRDAK